MTGRTAHAPSLPPSLSFQTSLRPSSLSPPVSQPCRRRRSAELQDGRQTGLVFNLFPPASRLTWSGSVFVFFDGWLAVKSRQQRGFWSPVRARLVPDAVVRGGHVGRICPRRCDWTPSGCRQAGPLGSWKSLWGLAVVQQRDQRRD